MPNDCHVEHQPISSSSLNPAPLSGSSCAASRRPLNRSWRSSTLSPFLRASTISSMYCCTRYEAWITGIQLGRLGITDLQLLKCQFNVPRMFRQMLRPIRNNNFLNQIGRQYVKGVLESHLMAGRKKEVTCPCHATPEP